jgi:hypothetical protein
MVIFAWPCKHIWRKLGRRMPAQGRRTPAQGRTVVS